MTLEVQDSPACDDPSTGGASIPSRARFRVLLIARGKPRRRLLKILLLVSVSVIPSFENKAARAQAPVSIFGNAVPANAVEADYNAVTLGMKFWSSQAGTIPAIRFYRGTTSPSGYVARLYSASGGLLASATMPTESAPVPGWQTAILPSPISVSPNTTYVVAYYTPNGQYADDYYGLKIGIVAGSLNIPASSSVGGNGVYYYGLGFPRYTWEASNYYVDLLFTPAGQAPALSLSFEPPNPSIPNTTPLGATVATIIATWSNGKPFTGTLGFGSPYSDSGGVFAISGNSLIINPSGPGVGAAGGTVEHLTIIATQ
jgi:hypothetical protein